MYSQHGLTKKKHGARELDATVLVAPIHLGYSITVLFCDKIACLVGKGKAVDVISLDFSEAFDTVPHSILLDKVLNDKMQVLFSIFIDDQHAEQKASQQVCW